MAASEQRMKHFTFQGTLGFEAAGMLGIDFGKLFWLISAA